jgi:SAM-dependent methyltransferase
MTVLLFPGRHLLQTNFQEQYLRAIVQSPLDRLEFLPGVSCRATTPIDTIVFAITSANHQFTRYNPIPLYIRAIGVDRFAADFAAHFAPGHSTDFGVSYRIYGIPHYAPSAHFASILIKEIAEQTEGELSLSPSNTIVLTSTVSIAAMFQAQGFAILPAEASATPMPAMPQVLLNKIMAAGDQWHSEPELRSQLSPTTIALWRNFPEVPRRVFRLWHDPLLTEEGSLTEDRNYSIYAYDMSNAAIIDLKYGDIKRFILPGRIVDEGCADGALLVRVAQDYPDSDLIGIEITGELLARCHERQRSGEFGDAFVHFHQRNITTPIFQPATIHTTICNSTLHELWSYNQGEATILAYLHEKYRQLANGGRLLIRDVVGPANPDETVYLWLDDKDGIAWDDEWHDSAPDVAVAALSTYARFFRFAQDFLPQRRTDKNNLAPYRVETRNEQRYIVTTMRLAVEYMTKKDYLENWESEMHEEFAFWSFADWKLTLQTAGFTVNPASHVYTNQWIVENRWQGKVALFHLNGNELQQVDFPPTTIVLAAEKTASAPGSADANQTQIGA